MKVIGAGFGRTGTESTQAALERLLGGKCYHMKEVLNHPDQLAAWEAFIDRGCEDMDWQLLLKDYVAGVDWPVCNYYKELMVAFPDAKVLLTLREPQQWFQSFQVLVRIYRFFQHFLLLIPMMPRYKRMMDNVAWQYFEDIRDEAHCIDVYLRHIEEVKAHVPAERLLLFQIAEGWAPLCDFLGVEAPAEPFPHKNKRGETEQYARELLVRHCSQSTLPILLFAVLMTALWFLLR